MKTKKKVSIAAQLIKAERKRQKLSAEKLGEEVGVSQSAISSFENGITQLSALHLVKVCAHLGLDPTRVFAGLEGMPEEDLDLLPDSNARYVRPFTLTYVDLPFITVPARASFVEMCGSERDYGSFDTFRVYLDDANPADYKGSVVIEINGDSMEGTLRSGMKVIADWVDPANWEYQVGKVYAISYADYFVVKRIKANHLRTKGYLELRSDNPAGGELTIMKEDIRCIWRVKELAERPSVD